MQLFSFRNFRILLLIAILATVAIYSKTQLLRSTAWLEPMQVSIYPINGDNSPKTARYIQGLSHGSFSDIDQFMQRESKKFNLLEEQPTRTTLGSEVMASPPPPPEIESKNTLSTMLWSLKLRYWAWKNTPDNRSNLNRVRIFVLYYQPNDEQPLAHSLGIQKGLIGVVHAFASKKQQPQNNIVIAHELLHTVGASDKYDNNNQPIFPDGYAEPNRNPRYPQYRAEIMSGRIPTSLTRSQMAKSLKRCVVGLKTAREINWVIATRQ